MGSLPYGKVLRAGLGVLVTVVAVLVMGQLLPHFASVANLSNVLVQAALVAVDGLGARLRAVSEYTQGCAGRPQARVVHRFFVLRLLMQSIQSQRVVLCGQLISDLVMECHRLIERPHCVRVCDVSTQPRA